MTKINEPVECGALYTTIVLMSRGKGAPTQHINLRYNEIYSIFHNNCDD
jgi:hypothetical protein